MSGTRLTIVGQCSLCGHRYSGLFNEPEMAAHMAGAHDMYFVPGSLRPGDPPRWVLGNPHRGES